MGRSGLSLAGLLGLALGSGVGSASAAETSAASKWRSVCTLSGDDLSFAHAQVDSGRAPREVERLHADHAAVVIEVDGTHVRVRAHVTAPIDAVVTTNDFTGASLSARAGATLGGVVKAEQPGVVRVVSVTGNGRALTVAAGELSIGGLPLRCEDLAAVRTNGGWSFPGMTKRVSGVRRIHAAPGAGPGFSVDTSGIVNMEASAPVKGDWRSVACFGYSGGKPGFTISGWVQGAQIVGQSSMAGGSIHDLGFRSCAPRTPARMGFVTLPAGTVLFESASGDEVWTSLTAPVRALVALYPRDRVALAGLHGWGWPAWKCETAWVDPDGLLPETTLLSPAEPAARAQE